MFEWKRLYLKWVFLFGRNPFERELEKGGIVDKPLLTRQEKMDLKPCGQTSLCWWEGEKAREQEGGGGLACLVVGGRDSSGEQT